MAAPTIKRIWWEQIKSVIRLEMKKTFFAKRGLWIYVLAALPVMLFIAFAIATSSQQDRRVSIARQSERSLTYQDLLAVKPGMTNEEAAQLLGISVSTAKNYWVFSRAWLYQEIKGS